MSAVERPFRLVVIGSESAGKSTLAAALATHFGAPLVSEYARSFAEGVGRPLTVHDVEPIATGQMRAEDEAIAAWSWPASDTPALVVLDTDLVSTVVYAHHYYGRCPAWIIDEAARRLGDLYLFLAPDVPWIHDGIRDRRDSRAELHALFHQWLTRFGATFREIEGTGDARLSAAVAIVGEEGGRRKEQRG
jgi:NadR type nicotinamide-nucleotide adenylyltransferase